MTVLVTTANGMFGGAVVRQLAARDVDVRAMVRTRSKFTFAHPRVEVVEADLDRPETLPPTMAGVDAVFLASPMDPRLAARETAVIAEAHKAGVRHVVKIGGAVQHGDDDLSRLHGTINQRLEESGMAWTYVSPNSVMETSLLGYAPSIKEYGCFFGISGHGRIGLVALDDIAEVTALVLTSDGHQGRDYKLTGPEALDLFAVAEVFSRALGKPVTYQDMPEAEFKGMLAPILHLSDEAMELGILCHLRCWRDGKAELVTDTFKTLTGHEPTSLEAWVRQRREVFA